MVSGTATGPTAHAGGDARSELQFQPGLQCMEIWGGNTEAGDAISVPGIDVSVFSRPFEGADGGGDLYYVSLCGSGNISRFAVADVSGHGGAVEGLSSTLRRLIRKNINTVNQAKLTRALNSEFGEAVDGGLFATAVLMTYYAPTDHLIVSNAGHPKPLLYRAETDAWSFLDANVPGDVVASSPRDVGIRNLPLGIIEPTGYEQFAVKLGKGDVVIAYTDALNEACSPDGAQLGEAGLLDAARRLDVSKPSTLSAQLIEEICGFTGSHEASDDLTVMVLHHNAADPPRQGVGDIARTLGRLIGLVSSDRKR